MGNEEILLPHHKTVVAETKRPASWILRRLPTAWVPYAELARVHKPVGFINIALPYLFGCLLAACMRKDDVSPHRLAVASAQMFFAACILRSLGCAWNDMVDAKVDADTERCRLRPMARGALTVRSAGLFTFALLVVWCYVFWSVADGEGRTRSLMYVAPVPVMAMMYPFAKWFTSFPQLFLGVTLALGVPVGATHLGVDIFQTPHPEHSASLACLFVAYVVFTLIHDTIYGFQDLADDQKNGVKSMAIVFADWSMPLFAVLSSLQLGSLVALGVLESLGWGYYAISCGGMSLTLWVMLVDLDTRSPKSCWVWFQAVSIAFGVFITGGFLWEYVIGM